MRSQEPANYLSMTYELSLVVPLFNEEENVQVVAESLVSELEKNQVDYELILVNNGSFDKTPDLVESLAGRNARIKAVHVAKNEGYGWGILSGLRRCQGRYLGYVWGDNQVRAEDVIRVFNHLRGMDLDLCKVKRISRKDGVHRYLLTKVYNYVLFPFLFSVPSRDINGCPKIFKREVFEALNLVSKDWFIDPEIMIKAHERGFKIGEIPVVFHRREKGVSKVRFSTMMEFTLNLLKYKFKGNFRAK